MKTEVSAPQLRNLLIEKIHREESLRFKWNRKHTQLIREAAQFHHPPHNDMPADLIRRKMERGMPALARDYLSSAPHRRTKQIPDLDKIQGIQNIRKEHPLRELQLGFPEDPRLHRPDTDLSLNPVMAPVDPKDSELLYEEHSPSRRLYLKNRMKISPDKKYYFPMTTYMEYGWRPERLAARGRPGHGPARVMLERSGSRWTPVTNYPILPYGKCWRPN